MKPRRFRFWVYWKGSPVKLTLTAENTEEKNVCFHHTERCDEGWSSEFHFYWLETELNSRGDATPYVHSVIHTDGRDCDGRCSQTSSWSCPTHRLAFYEREGILWPEWKEVSRKQRDFSAEAMNY